MKGLLWAIALLLFLGPPVACRATATPQEPGPSSPKPTLNPGEPSPPTPQIEGVVVVFHPAYLRVYSQESAAAPGRIEAILKELQGVPGFIFTEPEPASEEDLRRVHTQRLIDSVKPDPQLYQANAPPPVFNPGLEAVKLDPQLYETARLSAGGAILASEMAMAGEVSMAINRPPGHHASLDSYGGYCYFNNIAVAVKKLLDEKKIERALIVDFDLHFGDGTSDIFDNPQDDDPRVTYFHVVSQKGDRTLLLQKLEAFLSQTKGYDILAVSAGFDGGKEDWGGIFEIQDYTTIGTLLKEAAERNCRGKRFAVLEGGYNQNVLGKNIKAFLEGFR